MQGYSSPIPQYALCKVLMFVVFVKVTAFWFVGMLACLSTVKAPPNSQSLSSYYPRSLGSQTDKHSLVFKGAHIYISSSLVVCPSNSTSLAALNFYLFLTQKDGCSLVRTFLYHSKVPWDSRHGDCGVQLMCLPPLKDHRCLHCLLSNFWT